MFLCYTSCVILKSSFLVLISHFYLFYTCIWSLHCSTPVSYLLITPPCMCLLFVLRRFIIIPSISAPGLIFPCSLCYCRAFVSCFSKFPLTYYFFGWGWGRGVFFISMSLESKLLGSPSQTICDFHKDTSQFRFMLLMVLLLFHNSESTNKKSLDTHLLVEKHGDGMKELASISGLNLIVAPMSGQWSSMSNSVSCVLSGRLDTRCVTAF